MNNITSNHFVKIKPFDDNNELNISVLSDHAEIGIVLHDNNKLLAWNISNPKYHPYFKYGETFKKSHLYIEKPYDDTNNLIPMMEQKIATQIEIFVNNIKSNKYPIQVCIEGFEYFYEKLTEQLNNRQYKIIREEPIDKTYYNISGIIVNTQIYKIIEHSIKKVTYIATEDNNKEKTTLYPCVKIQNIDTNYKVIIIAAHVNGCNSQYPESGLNALHELMNQLHVDCDVIAIGDFNSPPDFIQKVFHNNFCINKSNYLTHCNPNLQAAKYDVAVSLSNNSNVKYKMIELEEISLNSKYLVESINNSIIN